MLLKVNGFRHEPDKFFLAPLQDHADECEKKPMECPNSCGEIIVREEVGDSFRRSQNLSIYVLLFDPLKFSCN